MAVSIVRSPRAVSWSRNPIVFELEGENYYTSIGSYGELQLVFDDFLEDMSGFKLEWGDTSINTVQSPTPIDGVIVLTPPGIGQTLAQWVSQVADLFNSMHLFYRNFVISSSGTVITIRSRRMDSRLDITCPLFPASKMDAVPVSTATSVSTQSNYAMLMELWVSGDGVNYVLFTESIIEPEENSKVVWNIQEYLTAYLQNIAVGVKDLSSTPQVDDTCRLYYKLRMAEMYGSPQIIYPAQESSKFVAFYGGAPVMQKSIMVLPDYFVDDAILKWVRGPIHDTIYSNQQDYLHIINFVGDKTAISVKCRLTGADESTRTVTIGTVAEWSKYDKMIVPVSLDSFSTAGIDNISMIEIWLEANGSRISESTYIKANTKHLPYGQTLLFRNSLGCMETIYTFGKKEYNYDIERESDVFVPYIEPTVEDATRKDIYIELINTIRINSGYQSRKHINRFRDFFLSEDKYIYQNGRWVPVQLDTTSIKEQEDGNFLYGITFTLKQANEESLWG